MVVDLFVFAESKARAKSMARLSDAELARVVERLESQFEPFTECRDLLNEVAWRLKRPMPNGRSRT